MTVYYVSTATNSPAGSDSNPGTIGAPFLTFAHAFGIMSGSDTLFARSGTYAEAINDNVPGGSSGNNTIISAYQSEVVTLQPASGASVVFFDRAIYSFISIINIILDAVNCTVDCVKITYGNTGDGFGAAHDITLQGCEIKNATGGQGVNIQGSQATATYNADNNKVINCKIHDNGNSNLDHGTYFNSNNNLIDGCQSYNNSGYGFQIFHNGTHTGPTWCTGNTIRNCLVHDNGASGSVLGVVISDGDSNLVYNNILYNNPGGIQIATGANLTGVYNNTCYNNGGAAFGAGGCTVQSNTTTNTVENNIFYLSSGALPDYKNTGTGTVSDYNLTGDATAIGAHSLASTNPLFVNQSSADFHLQASSPARDVGLTLALFNTDYAGKTRPQGVAWDMGALEFVQFTGSAGDDGGMMTFARRSW